MKSNTHYDLYKCDCNECFTRDNGDTSGSYYNFDELLRNKFVLKLKNGDKMDIYDEEMKYWEVATIQNVNPGTKQIAFTFDEDRTHYLWETHMNDVDIAPFKTHTLEYIALPLPNHIYVDSSNTQIKRCFDRQSNEPHILINARLMVNSNSNADDSSITEACKQGMRYNVTTNELYTLKDAAILPVTTHTHHCESHILIHKILVETATSNELHLIKHDLVSNHSHHITYDVDTTHSAFVGGFGPNQKLLYDGKLVYVSATNALMYFGGYRYNNNNNFVSDIWYFDLKERKKWKLYSLKLPRLNNSEFTVISAGELIFIFYYDTEGEIYIYNLSDKRAYKSMKKYPSPFQGKAVAIKTCRDWVHFVNATRVVEELKVTHRPYHFKIDLQDIIPKTIHINLNKRYKKLIYRYIQNNIHNSTLSLCLRRIIQQYFPLFIN